jgi:hypothetical protein
VEKIALAFGDYSLNLIDGLSAFQGEFRKRLGGI